MQEIAGVFDEWCVVRLEEDRGREGLVTHLFGGLPGVSQMVQACSGAISCSYGFSQTVIGSSGGWVMASGRLEMRSMSAKEPRMFSQDGAVYHID